MEKTKKTNPTIRFFKRLKSFHFSRSHYALPYLIMLAVLVMLPLGMMIFNSFRHDIYGHFTLFNYRQFFRTAGNWQAMWRSLYTAAIVTVACLILAYPVAFILSNPKFNRSTTIIFAFALPMWVNIMLRTIALRNLFFLMGIDLGYPTVVIGLIYDFFPFMLLPLYTSLSSIDRSYVEAGSDLGAGAVRNFSKITLPLSVPGIVSGSILIFMATVSNFAIADLLGSDIIMFGNVVNLLFRNRRLTGNVGSAFATILLVIIVASMLATSRLTRKKGGGTQGGGRL
ncbi:MAG: ABC transporter permease [Firmicutes bacterium]|nr:ABC transporter permease [Bacillota bacterium]